MSEKIQIKDNEGDWIDFLIKNDAFGGIRAGKKSDLTNLAKGTKYRIVSDTSTSSEFEI